MKANPIFSAPLRPRLAEAPLIGNGALYRLLVEESPDPLFLIDLETEVCAYASPAVRRLLGRDPGEIVGRRLTTLIHPDDVREALARSRRRREGRGVRTALSRMLHADGHWVWVQSRASSTLACAGRTVAVFSVSGASERARAEVGLRSTRTRMRSLLARLGEGGDLQQTRDGTYDRAVEALAAALELRDDESFQHARRVTELALELTAMVEPELAADPELRFAYLLHDIGKIGVPDTILLKRGPLTERELRVVQMHTTLGEHLISYIPFLSDVVHDVVAFHHERWDGKGYPWARREEEIPLAARIFAVVDAFDAMTSDRPYRKAMDPGAAIEELERCAGSQFDPRIVSAFLPIARKIGERPPA